MKQSADAADKPVSVASLAALDRTVAPPLVPDEPAIDRSHLARMTLGDLHLEREVLELFICQAEMLLGRMVHQSPRQIAGLSHVLLGSARGVGAWKVAAAAQVLEHVENTPAIPVPEALQRLAKAVDETKVAISKIVSASR
jgi:hypothetical protein